MRRMLGLLAVFALGVVLGGWLFAGTKWRPFLVPAGSGKGLDAEELRGLLGSIAVRRTPQVLPDVVMTTKYSIDQAPQAFADLEDQLCSYTPESGDSPDRMDALVWALTHLMLGSGTTGDFSLVA